jgi:neutral ceramidase
VFATLGLSATESGDWKAGVSKVVIRPSEPVWMAGYAGRSGPSDGVTVDLYARALALTDGNERRLVILTMDLIEIPSNLRELILNAAKKSHGLRPEELLLNVSHTLDLRKGSWNKIILMSFPCF